ncbi:hypothetical protein C7B64_04235 [Merismopedia glauca CCAP 1448/3]|uniref:Uncharacterized protein n=1 Tax=Merismopedia glauca CCAP 1448/3 TaxID=1296344 RepID=A0A2T1C803_9CYAN|nr:hypothetical protein C7B64_04235 [Merismopedia glauca CCAP 1448/3]
MSARFACQGIAIGIIFINTLDILVHGYYLSCVGVSFKGVSSKVRAAIAEFFVYKLEVYICSKEEFKCFDVNL